MNERIQAHEDEVHANVLNQRCHNNDLRQVGLNRRQRHSRVGFAILGNVRAE